jgi:sucrose-phosphate synthase
MSNPELYTLEWAGQYMSQRLSKAKILFISDLDGTLVRSGQDQQHIDNFSAWMKQYRKDIIFGIATGRNKEHAIRSLEDYNLPQPEILITSVGTELYYTEKYIQDKQWEEHIAYCWNRNKMEEILYDFPKITLQEQKAQRKHKLSYEVDPSFNEDDLANLNRLMQLNNIEVRILHSEYGYLDLFPIRASKGTAISYLYQKWQIGAIQCITAGNAKNDLDMLEGNVCGIVVSNYRAELETLKSSDRIYFSKEPLAKGVLEGLKFWTENS